MPDPPATAFSSMEGQQLFCEALLAGDMGAFFRLIEQFRTQDEPAYCGLSSLTMVLNALNVDPKRTWKGPWRWFHESMLDCCEPLKVVQEKGITFSKLVCLARCNGAAVDAYLSMPINAADSSTEIAESEEEQAFRRTLQAVCRGRGEKQMIISYSRQEFGQTGDGHFSPVGGYHSASDRLLLLDVARFKYPPHWLPLRLVWKAMCRIDPETAQSRGYMVLSARTDSNPAVLKLTLSAVHRDAPHDAPPPYLTVVDANHQHGAQEPASKKQKTIHTHTQPPHPLTPTHSLAALQAIFLEKKKNMATPNAPLISTDMHHPSASKDAKRLAFRAALATLSCSVLCIELRGAPAEVQDGCHGQPCERPCAAKVCVYVCLRALVCV